VAKIVRFEQLEAWQQAHKLVLMVYRVTGDFPAEEKFGLVSQMRRAAVSIPANIAEGFKRRGLPEKTRFYNVAEASLEELRYDFILSKDLQYMPTNDELVAQSDTVGRLLYGLISSTQRRRST
jgi:four helix bundle protein